MTRSMSGFLKGLGAGMAAGLTVATVGKAVLNNNKGMKKKANKAMRTVGDIIDNVQYMMK